MVKKLEGEAVEIFSDSRLVVGKINGDFKARDQQMQGCLNKVRRLQSSFEAFSIRQVPRSKNAHANSLATLTTSSEQGLPRIIVVEDLLVPNNHNQTMVGVHHVKVGLSWIDPLVSFLNDGVLPKDKGEAEKI